MEGAMPTLIETPTVIQAAGYKPKRIEEYVGRVNSEEARLSVARMTSPAGWVDPGQRPQFDEFTVVLAGWLRAKTETGETLDVRAGQAIHTRPGEWAQYSTPQGAEYIAVCLPAFSPQT